MRPSPFERFVTTLANLALAGKYDKPVSEWVSQRHERHLRDIHKAFDDYNDMECWEQNPSLAIHALKSVAALEEKDRPAFTEYVRGILNTPQQYDDVKIQAFDTLLTLGDTSLEGLEAANLICSADENHPLRRKALGVIEELGRRIIDTRNQPYYEILNRTLANLANECAYPNIPQGPGETVSTLANLGVACIRNGLEPMTSTVLSAVDIIERGSKEWLRDKSRFHGKTSVAALRNAAVEADQTGKIGGFIPLELPRHELTPFIYS